MTKPVSTDRFNLRRVFVTLLLSLNLSLAHSPAFSADLIFLTGAAEPESGNSFVRTQCNIRLSGEIETGDAARFEEFIREISNEIEKDRSILGYPRIVTLCLNSTGGSLDEGIKIAELIRQERTWLSDAPPFIATRLEAGATCESACAIVFLAGTLDDWEGDSFIARSMHPTARLGVHAPSLVLPSGQYDERFVTDAYRVSLRSIAEILRVLHLGENQDGQPYQGGGSWIKASLLEAMLQTPSNAMRYVETVDDAGRWGLEVFPIKRPEFTSHALLAACFNRNAWREDRSAVSSFGYVDFGQIAALETLGAVLPATYEFTLDELNGPRCSATITGDAAFSIAPDTSIDQEQRGLPIDLFDPRTALRDTAVTNETPLPEPEQSSRSYWTPPDLETAADFEEAEAAAIAQGDAWGARYGGDRIGYWDHNGSGMAWESKDETLWVWYFRPREGLEEVGVLPGSLLLFDQDRRDENPARARRFSNRCDDVIYSVRQTSVQTRRILFEGTYIRPASDCSAGEARNDSLTFDYLGQSPDRPDTFPDGTAPPDLMRIINVNSGLNFRAGPSSNAEKIDELPAELAGISLLACRPAVIPGYWATGDATYRRNVLDESWCSLLHRGQVGFVSGRFLEPQ